LDYCDRPAGEPNPASLKISHYLEQPKHVATRHPAMAWRDSPEDSAHRVPLAPQAVDLLRTLWETRHAPQVSPARAGDYLRADSVAKWVPAPFHAHGFRTSFANWNTDNRHDFETTEKCLAHNFADATSRAYRRSDLLDQRRAMLEKWADFLGGKGDLLDT
jgi:integrase